MAVDVFDILAKLRLDDDEYNRALDNAEGNTKASSGRLGNIFGGLVKGTAAMVGTASVAIGALMKTSIANYANYEQLVGGIETLFKGSQDKVMKYAENAYKTAGMSANQYMETVTGFSASLIQSLNGDTEKAAEKANQAITDMSDNANKMGTSMDVIEQTYQGFAKQNYTMLDNLKLGYGGTQEEMKRLLEDASAISGIKYDVSSYADVVDAIHVVQTEMGITGTTAKEAGSTIQGSISMAKSAWENLLTGMSNPDADLGKLVGDLVTSATTVLIGQDGNGGIVKTFLDLAPNLTTAIVGVFESVIPMIVTTLQKLMPAFADGVLSLINALTAILPELIQTILPPIIAVAPDIVMALINGILDMLPMIVDTGLDLIETLAKGVTQAIPELLPKIVDVILKIVDTLTDEDNLAMIIESALSIMLALTKGILQAIPDLVDALPDVLQAFIDYFTSEEFKKEIKQFGIDILLGLIEGLLSIKDKLVEAGKDIIDTLKGVFTDKEGFDIHSPSRVMKMYGKYIMEGLDGGLTESEGQVLSTTDDMIESVKSKFSSLDGMTASASIVTAQTGTYSFGQTPKQKEEANTNALLALLVEMFSNGTAKTSVDNTRELRRALA